MLVWHNRRACHFLCCKFDLGSSPAIVCDYETAEVRFKKGFSHTESHVDSKSVLLDRTLRSTSATNIDQGRYG